MAHPLVEQIRFTRSEFRRGLAGLTEAEAQQRFVPMNCISWNVGHLAWQEQRYFLWRAQGQMPQPEINRLFAYGAPACTPALSEVLEAWETITRAVDPWLDALTSDKLLEQVVSSSGKPSSVTFGSLLLRTIYHYWYHNGENQAIRQMLGHSRLPVFVGDIDGKAPYRRE